LNERKQHDGWQRLPPVVLFDIELLSLTPSPKSLACCNCSPWSVGQQNLQDWQDKTIDPFEGTTRAKTQSRKGKSATLHHAVKN
jgi:hypothetical protein